MAGDGLATLTPRGLVLMPVYGDHESTDCEGTECSDLGEATPQGSKAPCHRLKSAPGRAAAGCTAALVALAFVAAWRGPLPQLKQGAGIGHMISADSEVKATYTVEWYQVECDTGDTRAGYTTSNDYSEYSGSLSADGSTYATCGYVNDANGMPRAVARVYQFDGTLWTQLGADIGCGATDDFSVISFSYSLCGDGSTFAIAAYGTDGTGAAAGYVRLYRYDEGASTWNQLGDDVDCKATTGISVSLSADGNSFAMGTYVSDESGATTGYVRVYQCDGTTWTTLGSDIECKAAHGFSWFYVSLCADGSTFAIETYSNDGKGNNSGYVQVYQYGESTWTKKGGDIDCEARNYFSGSSVSLSADGSTVAVCAYGSTSAEHIGVYRYDETSWTKVGSDIDGEASSDYSRFSVALGEDGSTVRVYQYGKTAQSAAASTDTPEPTPAQVGKTPQPTPASTEPGDCDADCTIGGETYSCKVRLAWLVENGPGSDENHYSKHSGPPGGEISCSNYLLKMKHECPSCESCPDSVACP